MTMTADLRDAMREVATFVACAVVACLCAAFIVAAVRANPLVGIAVFWGIAGIAMDLIENEGSEHL